MPNLRFNLPVWVWQMLLMGLLGLSGIIFVPVLLRWVEPQLMATVLVAQVYVYYLVVLVQFSFAWSGPANVAKATHAANVVRVWQTSVQAKLVLFLPALMMFGVGYAAMATGAWYMWVFVLLLAAFAANSNWFLQAKQNFVSGVGFAALGVVLSTCLLYALAQHHTQLELQGLGGGVVLILVLPQVCVGLGTYYVARKSCAVVPMHKASLTDRLRVLRKDWPLVASQLLLLASTTLGTVVVSWLADATTTAAYAATEKLFNLGATVLVGLYMALHPRFAVWFYTDRATYWKRTLHLLGWCIAGGLCLALLLSWVGDVLLSVYLPAHLALLVLPALVPFSLWLGLCIGQHVLTGYLVFAERNGLVLRMNAGVLLITMFVGYSCARVSPVAWVYGMLIGQVFAMLYLLRLRYQDKAVCV